MTRLMRPPELERQRSRDSFDPVAEGARYGLAHELSLAIWERVYLEATDAAGWCDLGRAQQRFQEIAARIAAGGGRLLPEVGRLTRVEGELWGDTLRSIIDEFAPRVPGRTTRVTAEARRWALIEGVSATVRETASAIADRSALPGAHDVATAMAGVMMSYQSNTVTQPPADAEPEHNIRSTSGLAAERTQNYSIVDLLAGHVGAPVPAPPSSDPTPPKSATGALFEGRSRDSFVDLLAGLASTSLTGHTMHQVPARAKMSSVLAEQSAVARIAAAQARGQHVARSAEPGSSEVDHHAVASAFAVIDDTRGGDRLPDELARRLTRDLGVDLSQIRIHCDERAARIAAQVGARALTVRSDIYFAAGAYDPTTAAGIELIAHEVMHVAQNARGAIALGDRAVSRPDDPHERQAVSFASQFISTRRPARSNAAVELVPAATARRGELDRSDRIDRAPAQGGPDEMWQQMFQGKSVAVGKLAHVSAPKGIILKAQPAPDARPVSAIIDFDKEVFVVRTTTESDVAKRWAFVTTTGSGGSGFIEERFLVLDPPEPRASLYIVQSHQRLGKIVGDKFGADIVGGNDARLYVQAIYELNKGRPGIWLEEVNLSRRDTLPRREAEEETLKVYLGIHITADHAIWIPSVAGGESKTALKKYVFAPGDDAKALERVREKSQKAGEEAYEATLKATKDPKLADRKASDAVRKRALLEAKTEAVAAAEKEAEKAVKAGSVFKGLDPQAKGQLAAYQGGAALEVRRLATTLPGKSEKEFLDIMAKEVADGRVGQPRSIPISGPPAQHMQMWEYPDGSEIRFKPLGDTDRAGPTFSIEVKKNPSVPDADRDAAAFKIDQHGRAVPKNDSELLNPYSKATNVDQFSAFEDAVMNSVHFSLK